MPNKRRNHVRIQHRFFSKTWRDCFNFYADWNLFKKFFELEMFEEKKGFDDLWCEGGIFDHSIWQTEYFTQFLQQSRFRSSLRLMSSFLSPEINLIPFFTTPWWASTSSHSKKMSFSVSFFPSHARCNHFQSSHSYLKLLLCSTHQLTFPLSLVVLLFHPNCFCTLFSCNIRDYSRGKSHKTTNGKL